MRLYLSSHRMGDAFDMLLAMVKPGARTAVIENAADLIPAEHRASYRKDVHDPVAIFRERGLDAFSLDLRDYFGRRAQLARHLAGVELVWVTGGNAFLLMRAMRQSGFDDVIRKRLAKDDVVYGGFSAGACVAGATLRGINLMDDPISVGEGYRPEPIFDSLHLIDVAIVPHFRSQSSDADAADRVAEYMRAHGIGFVALRDGEALIQNGARRVILGKSPQN